MTINVSPQSEFQAQLFADLTQLVATSNGEFLTKNYPIDGHENLFYQVFTYSLPKFSSFKAPNGLNCRGTMFLVDKNTGNAELVALPMEKFFSLGEGDNAESRLKIEDAVRAFLKIDGTLLTSYIDPITQKLSFKSKNVPVYINTEIVRKSLSAELESELFELAQQGINVDLELTTPENRVMMEYTSYKVHTLKARCNMTGEYIDIRSDEFKAKYPVTASILAPEIPISEVDVQRKDIEGYVLEFKDGRSLKVKTVPYLSIVGVISIQDMSKLGEKLYKAVIDEVIDEVRSLYVYREQSDRYPLARLLEQTDIVEAYASKTYNEMVNTIETFYAEHKHLDKGSYAREASQHKLFMDALMCKYMGKDVNYKQLAIKLYAKKALS